MKPKVVTVELLRGAGGWCLSVAGQRVAGMKSWNGYTVEARWNIRASELREAIAAAPQDKETP